MLLPLGVAVLLGVAALIGEAGAVAAGDPALVAQVRLRQLGASAGSADDGEACAALPRAPRLVRELEAAVRQRSSTDNTSGVPNSTVGPGACGLRGQNLVNLASCLAIWVG